MQLPSRVTAGSALRRNFDGVLEALRRTDSSATFFVTDEEMDTYEDIPLAVLALCADMYELRQATTTALQVNPTTLQILSQHSVALL